MFTGLIWFLLGVMSTVIFAVHMAQQEKEEEKPKEKRAWTSIDNLRFDAEYEWGVKKKVDGKFIGQTVATNLFDYIEKRPPTMEVLPGEYTVHMDVNVRFVKRD